MTQFSFGKEEELEDRRKRGYDFSIEPDVKPIQLALYTWGKYQVIIDDRVDIVRLPSSMYDVLQFANNPEALENPPSGLENKFRRKLK